MTKKPKKRSKKLLGVRNRIKTFPSSVGYSWMTIYAVVLIVLIGAYVVAFHRQWLNLSILLEYTEVLIWPVVVIVGILAIRPHIPRLIEGRDLIFKRGENSLGLIKQEQATPLAEKAGKLPATKSTKVASSSSKSEGEDDLELSVEEKQAAFSRISTIIFGTQLDAILRLEAYGSLLPSELQDLVEEHRVRSGNASTMYKNLLDLMRYTVGAALVKRTSAGSFALTPYGQEYLNYVRSTASFPTNRPY